MTPQEYESFDRQVERKMKHARGGWFTVGWEHMHIVCDDKVDAGTLEKRWNDQSACIEYRAT